MMRSEEKKKNLPVGVDNFETMIQKNYYYFDKTGLIEEILKKEKHHF